MPTVIYLNNSLHLDYFTIFRSHLINNSFTTLCITCLEDILGPAPPINNVPNNVSWVITQSAWCIYSVVFCFWTYYVNLLWIWNSSAVAKIQVCFTPGGRKDGGAKNKHHERTDDYKDDPAMVWDIWFPITCEEIPEQVYGFMVNDSWGE